MARVACVALLSLLCAVGVLGDLYLHSMRGSNNRLNEANAQRNNADRLFDSQNNNRGGYNVGDKSATAATTQGTTPTTTYDETATTTTQQYQMVYYEGSIVQIEWTSQHGCGGNEWNDPHLQNCNMVLQFACDADPSTVTDGAQQVALRDGTTTNTVNTDGTTTNEGYHEPFLSYTECTRRSRNQGLFTADQNLNGNTAQYTRQNPNGNRRGLECPEERDYYPYWLPTVWRDIAILTDRMDLCPFYLANSQNTNTKFKCWDSGRSANVLNQQSQSSCVSAGGTWSGYTWAMAAPECLAAPWSRSNHLGNSRNGQMANYNWTIPTIASLGSSVLKYDVGSSANGPVAFVKCVFRIRYNITTDDYDPWNTNSTYNNKLIANNPTVDVGADLQGLKLAINTNQFGRTFQDRSHIFYIRSRPNYLAGKRIINLNVRGKRGNIVQTYPSMEYDFVPNRLHVTPSDYVHIQWTGSNTHNNGGNGGDGQTGDAGQGTGGTDRHNFVQIGDQDTNYALPLDTNHAWQPSIFKYANCWKLDGTTIPASGNPAAGTLNLDCALWLATSGFYRTATAVDPAASTTSANQNPNTDDNGNGHLSVTLNNAPASLIGGVVLQVSRDGQYNYIGTRNNNFSNRSQKGALIVTTPAP